MALKKYQPIALLLFLLGTAIKLNVVECFSMGPPQGACSTLSPDPQQHSAQPQTSAVPYEVDISALADGNGFSYEPGVTYSLTFRGVTDTTQFRGVLLQGRLAVDDSTPAGTFAATDPLTRLSSCAPPESGVSHNSGVDKQSITTMWTAPPAGSGPLRIGFAAVQTRTVYWANQRTALITERAVVTPPQFAFENAAVTTNENVGLLEFCVLFTSGTLTTSFSITLDGQSSTATEGNDFTDPANQVITFPAGAQVGGATARQCIFYTIINDGIVEGTEQFSVVATPAANFPQGNTATITIVDNDGALFQLGGVINVNENNNGPASVVIQIAAASGTLTSPVTINVATQFTGTATANVDFTPNSGALVFPVNSGPGLTRTLPIVITNDDVPENTETIDVQASIVSGGTFVSGGTIATATVNIMDDDASPPPSGGGDDPHFSVILPSGKMLCFTVQGEHGFSFNLISNKYLHMNALFVPDSHRSEVTWMGQLGIVVRGHTDSYNHENKTRLKFDAKKSQVSIGERVILDAKHVKNLVFVNGKLIISEREVINGKYITPSVDVRLLELGLHFTVKFHSEHLDIYWNRVGVQVEQSHGLIGQFFRKGVKIDPVRKFLVLPNKDPVPVMRRPVWSFMERHVRDDQLCWTAMNPGYQGDGLIDGHYLDYMVDSILSDNFVFKNRHH